METREMGVGWMEGRREGGGGRRRPEAGRLASGQPVRAERSS